MAKFKKLTGRHYRKEDGKQVLYKPGDIIEATEEYLRKFDSGLRTWVLVEGDPEPKVEAPKVEATKMSRKTLKKAPEEAKSGVVDNT